MKVGILATALILATLPWHGATRVARAADTQADGIIITEGDITDRPYQVLGDVTVSVKKAAIMDNPPIDVKVNNALRAKAAALHADAIILVHTESTGFEGLSFGHVDGHGRAIVFLKPGEVPTRPAAQTGNMGPVFVGRPTQGEMKTALHTYVNALNAGDAKAVASLYAEDGTVEDPLGSTVKQGRPAIEAWLREGVARGLKYELVAPIRGTNINAAAMTIKGYVGPKIVNATEIFTFTLEGKIASMKAYWGSEDLETAAK